MIFTVGQRLQGPRQTYEVQAVGREVVQLDGVWFRKSQLKRWIRNGVLAVIASEDTQHAEHSRRLSE